MSNPAQVTILAEDRRQARLVRAYLRRRRPDLPQRVIKDAPMANGRGSGAQWVLNRYAIEIRAYCTRRARKWLIVVIDADDKTVQERLNELHHQLQLFDDQRLHRFRAEGEQVARLVPKWSIETWILNLNGESIVESVPYKNHHRPWEDLIQTASFELCAWVSAKGELPARCAPSLVEGVRELRRLSF